MRAAAGTEQWKIDGQAAKLIHRQKVAGKTPRLLATYEGSFQSLVKQSFLDAQVVELDRCQLIEGFFPEFSLQRALLGTNVDGDSIIVAMVADTRGKQRKQQDRKSTRLNSSYLGISY